MVRAQPWPVVRVRVRAHVTTLWSSQVPPVHARGVATCIMTSLNGNIFALLALCEGNPPLRSFDVSFDIRHEQMVQQAVDVLVIWDVIRLIMTSL